jgi:hypothetical protein
MARLFAVLVLLLSAALAASSSFPSRRRGRSNVQLASKAFRVAPTTLVRGWRCAWRAPRVKFHPVLTKRCSYGRVKFRSLCGENCGEEATECAD